MKKEKKDKDFVKSPYFEGGRSAMDAYVKKELRYPKVALKEKIEGRVSLHYTVDYKGIVINTRVISGIGHGCDEEALRIVQSMVFKVPEQGKIKSKYSRKVHIHFRLPGRVSKETKTVPGNVLKNHAPTSTQRIQIQYQITRSKPLEEKSKPRSSTSYQIRISIPKKGGKNSA